MVSKYIGETENHRRKLFGGAQQKSAVISFDGADALLSKRSKVKDADLRYTRTSRY